LKKSIALCVVSVVSTFTFASAVFSQNGDCSAAWQAWSAKPGQEGAFPDTNVSYFRYTFEVPQDRKIALRVSARYPLGRYMGFNIYNTAKMNSVAGIGDTEINPDSGYENPYRSGDASSQGRYTLIMDPHDPQISQTFENDLSPSALRNESADPEAEKRKHYREIWYRIYDPSDGEGGLGQVELPKIEAIDQATGQVASCPNTVDIPVPKGGFSWGRLSSTPPGPGRDGELHLVHHQGMGLYANRDTSYLTARLKLVGASKQVVVLKFKAPRTAQSFDDFKNPVGFDVRYWSFCIGGAITTLTYDCIADRQAKVDEDGFVRIVVAPASFRDQVKGKNFLERPIGVLPVLIYRNLVSRENFEGAFSKIPLWGSRSSGARSGAGELAADKFIGDYAPVGRVCSSEEFLENGCPL
jgi:hypothetical protein